METKKITLNGNAAPCLGQNLMRSTMDCVNQCLNESIGLDYETSQKKIIIRTAYKSGHSSRSSPLAACGTISSSFLKSRTSGKCWHNDFTRICRNVDFPSTVLVVLSFNQKNVGLQLHNVKNKGYIHIKKRNFTQINDESHELICKGCIQSNQAYFSEKIYLKSSRFIGLGLAVIQIIPHSQHKLETNKEINIHAMIGRSYLSNVCTGMVYLSMHYEKPATSTIFSLLMNFFACLFSRLYDYVCLGRN